jgi:hypothetical protein
METLTHLLVLTLVVSIMYGLLDPERVLEVGKQAAFLKGSESAAAREAVQPKDRPLVSCHSSLTRRIR